MLLASLLHPTVSPLLVRVIGALAAIALIIALISLELATPSKKKQRLRKLWPIFVVGLIVLAYTVIIGH